VFCWVTATLLLVESALVLRRNLLIRNNPFMRAKDPEVIVLSQAAHSSLWKVPWVAYRPNTRLSLRRGGEFLSLSINSMGLRSPEVTVPRPEGRFRILCIGGSTTVEGYTNETTYPALLEKRLNEWWGGNRFEVVNAGITALNSATLLRRLDFLVSLEPDLVIHYNGVNDYMWIILPGWRSEGPLWHHLMSRSEIVKTFFTGLLVMRDSEFENRLTNFTLANRREMVAAFRERNIPVAIASFDTPDLHNSTPEERFFLDQELRTNWDADYIPYEVYQLRIYRRNEMVRDFCRQEGCIYFPVAERLNLGMEGYVDICHMNPYGISRKAEVMADLVIEYLRSLGDLPPARP
jgi:lysophospholipase L1-like esterase